VSRAGINSARVKKGVDVRVEQNSGNFFAQTLPCDGKPFLHAVTLYLHYKGQYYLEKEMQSCFCA
jgi:hypothetical protein